MSTKNQARYEVYSRGYETRGIVGNPGDIGGGYQPHRFISAHNTRAEAEAAAREAARPSETIHGTNSTWQKIEETYVKVSG
jgi:hypothetical protein